MTESVRVLIPEEEVNKRIKEMAEKISADIGDETNYADLYPETLYFFP